VETCTNKLQKDNNASILNTDEITLYSASIKVSSMPMSPYLQKLRSKLGHDLIYMAGVMAVVINDAGEVLLQRRRDNGQWGLPGGILDPAEEPGPATVREVWEETGIEVTVDRMIAIYAGKDQLVRYPNDDLMFFVQYVLACNPISGTAMVNDDESLEVRYFSPEDIPVMERSQSDYIALALRNQPQTDFRVNKGTEAVIMPISEYVRTIRQKIEHEILLLPYVGAVIRNAKGDVLLQHQRNTSEWEVPGGAIDPGEEPADAVIRTVYERIGIHIKPERVTGIYGGAENAMTYSNGDQVILMVIIFLCSLVSDEYQFNENEALEVRFFPVNDLPSMAVRTRAYLDYALSGELSAEFRRASKGEIFS
jgi:8-oxo-dGTP pyrophosphatase MutT (NUDIX family)